MGHLDNNKAETIAVAIIALQENPNDHQAISCIAEELRNICSTSQVDTLLEDIKNESYDEYIAAPFMRFRFAFFDNKYPDLTDAVSEIIKKYCEC